MIPRMILAVRALYFFSSLGNAKPRQPYSSLKPDIREIGIRGIIGKVNA